MSDGPLLLREDDRGVARLTLNRPAQLNALSFALVAELRAALDAIGSDASVRVVVLAGSGRAFSAGHDLKEIRAMEDAARVEELFQACSAMMMTLGRIPQPVLARVHGIAAAAGCQLVAACDLAIAAEGATFATPGINVGAFCSTPAVALSRAVAAKPALEMLLTGASIPAARAAEIGLVNRVVPAERLDEEVESLARLLVSKPASALAAGKSVFYRQLGMPLGAAYALASEAIARDFSGADGREGVDAFLSKRPPRWA